MGSEWSRRGNLPLSWKRSARRCRIDSCALQTVLTHRNLLFCCEGAGLAQNVSLVLRLAEAQEGKRRAELPSGLAGLYQWSTRADRCAAQPKLLTAGVSRDRMSQLHGARKSSANRSGLPW